MEEIAPQDYKGPLPGEMSDNENSNVDVNQLKAVEPIEESPLNEQSVRKQIRSSESKNAPVPIVQQPADGNTSDTETQHPVLSDTKQQEEALNESRETVPIPERKHVIYFKHNSNELPDQSYDTLNRIAAYMLSNPGSTIEVKGYTDSTGSHSYNVSVSGFRANTIKIFLVGKGVDPAKIQTVGLGPENPIASNKTEEGRRKNRRVELELNYE
jgi:outer membrane protein OmpA-like peptidoglycan-associated protein